VAGAEGFWHDNGGNGNEAYHMGHKTQIEKFDGGRFIFVARRNVDILGWG
jgi:hypothetical protein